MENEKTVRIVEVTFIDDGDKETYYEVINGKYRVALRINRADAEAIAARERSINAATVANSRRV